VQLQNKNRRMKIIKGKEEHAQKFEVELKLEQFLKGSDLLEFK
jgi:hypothetical protein